MEMQKITKSRLCLLNKQKGTIMKNPAPNTLNSSNSFVLSLAEYLCNTVKIYPSQIRTQHQKEKSQKDLQVPFYYYEVWCDTLLDSILNDKMLTFEGEVVVLLQTDEQYLNYALKSQYFEEIEVQNKQTNLEDQIAQKFFNIEKYTSFQGKQREIMVINLSQSVTNQDKVKTKVNVAGLFLGIFYRRGDRWRQYRILRNQVPSAEQLAAANTVMISGSSLCVLNMPPLVAKFEAELFKALELNKKLKVAGFCFGHQMIAQAFGAKIQKRPVASGLQLMYSPKPHDLGEVPYLSELSNGQNFKIRVYQYHSDFITTVPKEMTCIGVSKNCISEIFVSRDKRLFTFQFHPQYLVEYIATYEKRCSQNSVFQNTSFGSRQQDEEHHITCQKMRKTIRNFIDWQI